MRKALFFFLIIFGSLALVGCQAFFEDYSYQPLGAMSSGQS